MSRVAIKEESLKNLADKIREKTGAPAGLDVDDMAVALEGIGMPELEELTVTDNGVYTPETYGFSKVTVDCPMPPEEILLTGDCERACSGAVASCFMETFPGRIRAEDVTNANSMFKNSQLEELNMDVPFKSASIMTSFCENCTNLREFNGVVSNPASSGGTSSFGSLFKSCYNLEKLPTMLYMRVMDHTSFFSNCYRLRELPEDFFSTWTFLSYNSSWYALSDSFNKCYSLRRIPSSFFEVYPSGYYNHTSSYASVYNNFAYGCIALEELVDMPVVGNYTSSVLGSTANECWRLSRFTFKQDNGAPFAVSTWKNQILGLSNFVGYANSASGANIKLDTLFNYNSGITEDKRVTDDASYQALKNDPDWWTSDLAYSRYNLVSAIETINSLPDVSSSGSTNTVTFKTDAGSKTDGGGITADTIAEAAALAAAKGWTVSLK